MYNQRRSDAADDLAALELELSKLRNTNRPKREFTAGTVPACAMTSAAGAC